ncbi:ribbon-helix-helix protein, CopG family [Candidatus Thiothrix anitrata]|uniref:Ribbon-helix-helix protein, CopG family n=1 Tax=Candidatus Thiothrix anitrata TaxID=2823902 RepID=A0ABX7X2L5_9GAMM|nr:ribbon-helix-helix protein, CopG family [Candidatus Thiothrix anitrata]QTR50154.1 ribbon-helix-helix protein, CopG family [Candidatus Thiothrix anitrata]
MHRTQVSLEDKQYRNLQRYAKLKNRSISAVIRELLDAHIPVAAQPKQQKTRCWH